MFASNKASAKEPIVWLVIGGMALLAMVAIAWDVLSAKDRHAARQSIKKQTTDARVLHLVDRDEHRSAELARPASLPRAKRVDPVEETAEAIAEVDETHIDESMTAEETYLALSNSFEMDSTSPVATRTTEQSIEGVFRSLRTPGAHLQNVECRTKSCRAVVEFSDVDADRGAFEEILDDSENPLGTFGFTVPHRERQPDGRIVATMFIPMK